MLTEVAVPAVGVCVPPASNTSLVVCKEPLIAYIAGPALPLWNNTNPKLLIPNAVTPLLRIEYELADMRTFNPANRTKPSTPMPNASAQVNTDPAFVPLLYIIWNTSLALRN